jgi:arabinan endo-1,5-alpha-L-arabinosidase
LLNWEPGPPVFSSPPSWATNTVPRFHGHCWAPDIIHLKNRYLLYYAASSWGVNTSAIGLAVNETLDPSDPHFHWEDAGMVIHSRKEDDYNTIDPCVLRDTGGKLWLGFGSFWSGIKLIQLDPETGKRVAADSPIYSLAHYSSVEAAYIYPHDGRYYLFVNWNQCCRGTNSTYNIRIGRGDAITGPYLDKSGADMLHDGGTLFLEGRGRFIGPGHAGILSEGGTNWFTCHFYDGLRRGAPTLGMGRLEWAADGWPRLLPVEAKPAERDH